MTRENNRITLTTARKLAAAGHTITVYMINDNPRSPWHANPAQYNPHTSDCATLDQWLSHYLYYNAGPERGRYAKYYITNKEA